MADSPQTQIRIFCLCGQKMRVSEKMFGLPGKCISCRQKIRIPRPEELPDDTGDLHLRDHPEFLRDSRVNQKVARRRGASRKAVEVSDTAGASSPVDEPSTPVTELDIAEEPVRDREPRKPPGPVPVDVLEALRNLCSVAFKLDRQFETVTGYGTPDPVLKAELEGRLAKVQRVRADLDEQLRQRLMETAIELSSTFEKMGEIRVNARVGEIDFEEYRDEMRRLRGRRDRLERRQQNLRGWMAADNPFDAGGFVDLTLESIPEDGYTVSIPNEPDPTGSAVEVYAGQLREGLERRAQAERKVRAIEAERVDEDEVFEEPLMRRNEEGEIRRAEALAGFAHGRLAQMRKDLDEDLETIRAQLETAKGRLQIGEIDRGGYNEIERELLRAKTDASKARSVVKRSLTANAAADVPAVRGTFLERLALGLQNDAHRGPDIYLAWVSAALLLAGTFLPALGGGQSLFSAFSEFRGLAGGAAWVFLVPVTLAFLAIAVTGLNGTLARGLSYLVLWFAGSIAAIYLMHEALYGLDPMSARFRTGTFWLARPGMFLFVLGGLGLLGASVLTLPVAPPLKKGLRGAVTVAGAGILVAAAVWAGLFGFTRATATVTAQVHGTGSAEPRAVVTIRNTGNRHVYLLSRPSDARGAYVALLERQIGPASWAETRAFDVQVRDQVEERNGIPSIAPGRTVTVTMLLEPGQYRASLVSANRGDVSAFFEIAGGGGEGGAADTATENPAGEGLEPSPPELTPEDTLSRGGAPSESEARAAEPGARPFPPATPFIELRGMVDAGDGVLRFTFFLTRPDGEMERVTAGIDDELWAGWRVSAYHPRRKTVTLENDAGLLILGMDQRIPLVAL